MPRCPCSLQVRFQLLLFKLVTNQKFEIAIMCIIGVNMIGMAAEYHHGGMAAEYHHGGRVPWTAGLGYQHSDVRQPGLRCHLHARVRPQAARTALLLLQRTVEHLRLCCRTALHCWSVRSLALPHAAATLPEATSSCPLITRSLNSKKMLYNQWSSRAAQRKRHSWASKVPACIPRPNAWTSFWRNAHFSAFTL